MRIFFCLSILLYHLHILKGGYLAVCSFFALSGYLSCLSAFGKEELSLKEYYKSRLFKLYLPLLIVVFLVVPVVNLFQSIVWVNLKPEVTSIIGGYNNFWQLAANMDYFSMHIDSPFMHLWYVAILIQLDVLFPLLYKLLKKFIDKGQRKNACLIPLILGVLSMAFFFISDVTGHVMFAYYSTFTRAFSWLFGITLGLFHTYYQPLIYKKFKKKPYSNIIFAVYMCLLAVLFLFVDASSFLFPYALILTTFVTCRLISYASLFPKKKLSKKDQMFRGIVGMGYEIYLIQYPLIFLFQYINWNVCLEHLLILVLLFFFSWLVHFICKKQGQGKILQYILRALIGCFALFGAFQYVVAKDHSKEMKALEEQLSANAAMMQEMQEGYAQSFREEEAALQELLNGLEKDISRIDEVLVNLHIVGVGDSVMLGATEALYQKFPNGYFDAKVSRTAWVANDILVDLKKKEMLGSPIIFNLGTNGDCSEDCKEQIFATCGDRDIFWITVTNNQNVHVNEKLVAFAKKHDNVHIIDWSTISSGHKEYFAADGIHLTASGRVAYIDAIYSALKEVYLAKYKSQQEELLQQHEAEKSKVVSFFGNDLLLGAANELQGKFEKAVYHTNSHYAFSSIQADLKNALQDETLSNKVVFAFDEASKLTKEEYQELIQLCEKKSVYVVALTSDIKELLSDADVTILDFSGEVKEEYFLPDKIHFNKEGNEAFVEFLSKNVK